MAGPGSRRSHHASNRALPFLAGALPLGALTLLASPPRAQAASPGPGQDAVALAAVPAETLSTADRSWPELAALPPLPDASQATEAARGGPAAEPSPSASVTASVTDSLREAGFSSAGALTEGAGDLAQATPDGAPAADPLSPAGDAPGATPAPAPMPAPDMSSPSLQPQAAQEPKVLISEVVIEGLDGHPEKDRLELAAYGAMSVSPGSEITRSQLRNDLAAVYATGWFADVRIEPVDGPLGVRLKVQVVPNPVLTSISLDPSDAEVPKQVVDDTFAPDLGKTLNLNTLQTRMQELQKWYADQGYSLARVTGPGRISPDGNVQLVVRQGTVAGVEVQFVNKEGSTTNDKG